MWLSHVLNGSLHCNFINRILYTLYKACYYHNEDSINIREPFKAWKTKN